MLQTKTLKWMLAGAAMTGLSGPAFALDGADVVAKLNAAYAHGGMTLAYENIEESDDALVLKGVTLKPASGKPLPVGEVTFDGIEEQDGGGYLVETVSLPDIDLADKGMTITAKDLTVSGLQIPGNPSGATLDDMLLYNSASTGPLAVTVDGTPVFSIAKSEANLTRQENDTGFDFDATISNISADLSKIQDAKSKDAIEKLGLKTVAGQILMSGNWELESGNFATQQTFDLDKIGRLSMDWDISGYTIQLITSAQNAFKAAEANPNKEAANQALGMSMMGLMQQLTFNSAQIRFEDETITKRVLDYVGAQQGVSGEQVAQMVKGMTPLVIAQMNLPELQNQITSAVNAYMDAPKSLTINAKPEKPVPFPMIMGAAMGAPNTVPGVIGVTVTAND